MKRLTLSDYQALAEFRFQIRKFLHFSEQAVHAARQLALDGLEDEALRSAAVGASASVVAAIAEVRPGRHWNSPHEAAVRVLARGFIDLGLCEGSLEKVIETEDYRRFYMHRTGHWLGLDVHDVGEYKHADEWRALEPGMTLTVEPGCYIRPGEKVPEAFWNIGVRIEDDVLVLAAGNEVITAAAPKTVADIEALPSRLPTLYRRLTE